jgi:hypothetical protein
MGALRLVPAATFDAPVKLTVAGSPEPAVVVFVFARKSKSELRAWVESGAERSDPDFLGEVVKGWRAGVVDEHDQPVPFSTDAFAALLDRYPAAGGEIYQQYMAAYHEARTKN